MRWSWASWLFAGWLAASAAGVDRSAGPSIWEPERRSALPADLVTSRPATAPATDPASRPAKLKLSQRPEAIERTAKYYVELYGRYLKTCDPLARTMVVISLTQLDDPRSTEMLVKVMCTDKVPVVRAYAWEAIHSRLDRVTERQRDQWVRIGYDLARKGYLRGDLRVGLVGAMAVVGPTESNRKLFRALFANTNSLDPADMRTLNAMGKLLAQWKSPDLVEDLIDAMDHHNAAWRAEYVLRPLRAGVPSARGEMHKFGSVVAWARAQKRWREWFRKARLRQIPVSESRCAGGGKLLPAGEKIVDAADPKWRKDLELEKFSLKQLDVGFVIDSTGSMGACIRWIQTDVVRIMRGFELISREPRIGVTFYRDHGDAWLVQPISLSNRAEVLAKQLKGARAQGGGDVPEAVLDGMVALARKNRWGGPSATKVVVLMGDAPPHERDLSKIEELIKIGTDKRFVFYAVKIVSRYNYKGFKRPNYDPKLTTFDKIAALGGGKSFWIDFHDPKNLRERVPGYAVPKPAGVPERVIFREVFKAAMAKGYEDRVNAFVNVLEQYIEWPRPEVRRRIPPWRPSRGGGPGRPPPDPQAQ